MSAPSEDLRLLVREVLAEFLEMPGAGRAAFSTPRGSGPSADHADDTGEVIAVTLRNDGDVRDFVLRVLALSEDPVSRQGLRTGQIRFALAGTAEVDEPRGLGDRGSLRIDRGALTEKAVVAAARDGRSIVLGKRAVATPLALDKARALGITVHQEAT